MSNERYFNDWLGVGSPERPRGTVSSVEEAEAAIARLVQFTDSRIPVHDKVEGNREGG